MARVSFSTAGWNLSDKESVLKEATGFSFGLAGLITSGTCVSTIGNMSSETTVTAAFFKSPFR